MERMPADIRERVETVEAENEKWRQLNKDTGKRDDIAGKPSLSPGRLVPIINKVAAGYPTDFNDLDYPVGVADDYIRCPDVHDPNAFAVRVVGDSMEPKFKEGDIIVFSPAAEVRNGDDCFVRFSTPHETTFKRVFFETSDTVRLQPRNEKYPPAMVDGKRINGIYRAIIRHETL
jgi:phage repressor protein C with HTH and peptisase S24 domain